MPDFTQKDRDMLIKHDIKLTRVCEELHKLEDKIDKNDGKINKNFEKMDSKADSNFEKLEDIIVSQQQTCIAHREKIATSYISKTMFRWIAGFIILGIIGIGVYSSDIRTRADINTYKITILEKRCPPQLPQAGM